MSFEIKGTLYTIFPTKQVTERFTKREFVVETKDGKYAQTILLQFTGDKVNALDGYSVGDEVRVEFNLRGRETNRNGESKFWNSLDAWKIEAVGERKEQQRRVGGGSYMPPPVDDGDIPFVTCDMAYEPALKVFR